MATPACAPRSEHRFVVRVLRAFSAASALTLTASHLDAQQRPDTAQLRPVVVTAERYPTPATSVPVSITVLSGNDLRAQGVRFVVDALKLVPGVHTVQSGSFGAVASTFVRGGQSDYVKVLIDGVPVNQPGGAFDWGTLATDNIERIEVLRGPASVLYGSDAVSGVVHIITRTGQGQLSGELTAEAGSHGARRLEGAARGGISRGDWSASLSRSSGDGIYDFNNDFRNTVATAQVRQQWGHGTASLAVRFNDGTFHFPTDFTGAVADRNQFATNREITLALDGGLRLTSNLEGQVTVGRYQSEIGSDDRPDPNPGPSSLFVRDATMERWSSDARLVSSVIPGARLVAGVAVDHQRERSTSRSDFGFGETTDEFRAARHNKAVYVQGAFDAADVVRLTVGGRVDANERFGTFTTWRAGGVISPTRTTRLRVAAGTAFKEPSFFENFATGFVVGNPDLRPERTTSIEGGIEQELANRQVTFGATAFFQRFRDIIQYSSSVGAGEPNYQNLARATANGLEASLHFPSLGAVDARVAYTWLRSNVADAGVASGEDAEFVEGKPLLRRPEHLVSARVASAWKGPVQLGAATTLIGARDDLRFANYPDPTRRVRLPSVLLVDFNATWVVWAPTSRTPGLTMQGRVENLFDQQEEQVAGFTPRGRIAVIGLSIAWR